MTRRFMLVGGLLLLVLVIAGGGTAVWHASASPQFCNQCHIMQPYVEAWKGSRHGAVACVECHYPPGLRDTLRVKFQAVTQVAKWATGTYSSKPFAEVEDASCLRSGCHAVSALEKDGTRTFGRGIRFAHGPHLNPLAMGAQLHCTTCHAQIVVDKHFEVSTTACFTCHFKGKKSGRELAPVAGCQACHEVPRRPIDLGVVKLDHEDLVRRGVACQSCHLNVVNGAGEAPRDRCLTCHNQAEKLERYPETTAVHAAHVAQRTIECTRCHNAIVHRLPPRIAVPPATAGARL